MLDAVTRKAGVFTLWVRGINCASSSAYVDWREMRIVDVEIIVGSCCYEQRLLNTQ